MAIITKIQDAWHCTHNNKYYMYTNLDKLITKLSDEKINFTFGN